jgi:DNA polymerase-4
VSAPRTILHVDMDAFFVGVELLDRPELRGRPVVVGGSGARGVVAAASYEARAYGVHSAMPSVRARRLCPQAVFLDGRHARYVEVSARVMGIFRSYTPAVEPISLDEAFLDVTGSQRLLGDAPAIAADIRTRVEREVGITCSVGVAPVKFVAKLASEAAKPKATPGGPQPGVGVKVVEPDGLLGFLRPLPARSLWGVGPATLARLERLGVATVGDIADLDLDTLTRAIGRASGTHLHALANGIDERVVESERKPKSVGHEETFATDIHDRRRLERELVRLADGVGARLRSAELAGRTVSIKVRFHDFRTITRSTTIGGPIDSTRSVLAAARDLLDSIDPTSGVRLLGVSVSGLTDLAIRQLTLDDALAADRAGREGDEGSRWSDASYTMDRIRERFGISAIGPASLVGAQGVEVTRTGNQPWGPKAQGPRAQGPRAQGPGAQGPGAQGPSTEAPVQDRGDEDRERKRSHRG